MTGYWLKLNNKYPHSARFRFYGPIRDFIPAGKMRYDFIYRFGGSPAVKDPIEAIGVPHTEVAHILVNSYPVNFSYRLMDSDYVSVFPEFMNSALSPETGLRPPLKGKPGFILDIHLGKLARLLRFTGFDSLYRNDYSDDEIANIAKESGRVVLTRDKMLLHDNRITRGYWPRSTDADIQFREIINRFDLYEYISPFLICSKCNGTIEEINKEAVLERLKPGTAKNYNKFYICRSCKQIYWRGAHFNSLKLKLDKLTDNEQTG